MSKTDNNSVALNEEIIQVSDVSFALSGTVPTVVGPSSLPKVSERGTPTKTSSTVLDQEDISIVKSESHSAKCEQIAESQEYKITLAHARKIALNSVKRAKNRTVNSADMDE